MSRRWWSLWYIYGFELNQNLTVRIPEKPDANKVMREVREPLRALVEMESLSVTRAFSMYPFHKYLSTTLG